MMQREAVPAVRQAGRQDADGAHRDEPGEGQLERAGVLAACRRRTSRKPPPLKPPPSIDRPTPFGGMNDDVEIGRADIAWSEPERGTEADVLDDRFHRTEVELERRPGFEHESVRSGLEREPQGIHLYGARFEVHTDIQGQIAAAAEREARCKRHAEPEGCLRFHVHAGEHLLQEAVSFAARNHQAYRVDLRLPRQDRASRASHPRTS